MTGLILIEGPDCTGKTTLCRRLESVCGNTVYLHATYPYEGTTDVRVYHLELLKRAMRESEDHLVLLDRLWPSELVYGALYRGGPQHPGYEVTLDKLVKRVAGVYVFAMYGSQEDYVTFAQEHVKSGRKELYVEKLRETYQLYKQLLKEMSSRQDVLQYQIAYRHVDDFVEDLLIRLQQCREHLSTEKLKAIIPKKVGR